MKKLNLFLLVAGFFVFSSCTERLEHNEEKSSGNVVINLSSVNAERGAVPTGYESVDSSKVTKWKLTFSPVSPYNDFPDEVRTIEKTINGTYSVTIGVGKYDLFVEGSYTEPRDTGDFTYKLSGACSGIVVEEGKKNVSVLVGPRKTTKGKGSFSATMSFMQGELADYYKKVGISSNDTAEKKSKRFKAELVSKKTGEIVYSTHSGGNLLVAEADSGGSSVTVKSTQAESGLNKISSGYYYFRFYADFAPVNQNDFSAGITPDWKELPIGDNLVEIADGLSTSWPPLSYSDSKSLLLPDDTATYSYYASEVDGSEENNGISQSAPGELYAVLDTIYNHPMVQKAEINYTYSDKIEFDVSKVQSGKQVTIYYKKGEGGDPYSFTIDEKGLTTFSNMNEELSLITTNDKVKSFNVKEINSPIKVCLNNGVYLDFSSFEGNEQSNIYFDVDDVEYYENHPMVVSSKSFNEKLFFVCSDYSHFTYDIVENSADSSYKYYAEEPVSPIVYYSNKYSQDSPVQYWIQYKENNPSDYNFSFINKSSLAAFCDDYNGGLYAFEFYLEGGTKVPSNPSGYKLVHFVRKKTDKSTEFTLEENNTIGYIKQQIPASMCTDGKRLYFVNTAATISGKGGKELSLSSWEHWAYENAIVYSVVAGNSGQSASEVQLNFDSVFTKVTAVYCQGINKDLYIAGYKTNKNGSTKDSTYCIYKLANPQNYTTSVSITAEELTKVSKLFTTSEDSSFIDWYSGQATQNVYAFNAITDMAIIDNNLYVLKNSYYFANADTTKITSSLIRINNNGQSDKTWSTADKNGYQNLMVARKFIAVLPKKKKLLISENARSCYYTGDFSDDDLSITLTGGSAYAFDGYDIAPTGFISGENFKSEADFIENVSSN